MPCLLFYDVAHTTRHHYINNLCFRNVYICFSSFKAFNFNINDGHTYASCACSAHPDWFSSTSDVLNVFNITIYESVTPCAYMCIYLATKSVLVSVCGYFYSADWEKKKCGVASCSALMRTFIALPQSNILLFWLTKLTYFAQLECGYTRFPSSIDHTMTVSVSLLI